MSKRIPQKRKLILAALAAASLAAPRAEATTGAGSTGAGGTSATTPGADTAYGGYHGDSNSGGTGMGTMPGRGGSSMDSSYGRDTLWSSPYDQPATPGTGLPNSSGAGQPGTGGSGMGNDSSGNLPGVPAPMTPGNNGATPDDSTGASDMMERG